MSRHGVTDEDVRREAEQDDANYKTVKEGGWCCLLDLGIGLFATAFILYGIITPLTR